MIVILNILFIVVILMLILSCGGRSAVWGGATWGLIIGAIIGLFTGNLFWGGKVGLTVGGCLGIISEILGKWSDSRIK